MDGILAAALPTLVSGFIAGSLFGFLLQRGGVSEFNVIVRQFLFIDFTVIKVILTAITVGGLGLYGLHHFAYIPGIAITVLPNMGVLVGGLVFGVGMATLGLCPGTCVAAAGQGSRDAWFGLLGMLVGALIFILYARWVHDTLTARVLSHVASLWQLFGVSPFVIFAVLAVLLVALHMFIKE